MGKGKDQRKRAHPRKPKQFKSPESYRKFRSYIHIRTPNGKVAKSKSQTISARTPRSRKEKLVYIGGEPHRPKISRG